MGAQELPTEPQLRVVTALADDAADDDVELAVVHADGNEIGDEGRERMNEQQDRDARLASGEAELEANPVPLGLQIGEALLDLHALPIAVDDLIRRAGD